MARLALVTGSTSGIGLGIAKALSGKGLDLVVNGFGSQEEVESAVEACRGEGASRVEHSSADLSEPRQISQLFNFVSRKWGRTPDILVNNAGMQYVSPVESFPPEKWDQLLAVNLSACFHTIRLALPHMKAKGWGRIVNVSSTHGLVASANKSAYVASKHGLIGLTKVVALETAGTGITSNAICPGWVLTSLTEPQIRNIAKKRNIDNEAAKKVLVGEKQPSGQLIMPEEVGSMVAYLCSDDARQVTGSSFSIDGGWTAQ